MESRILKQIVIDRVRADDGQGSETGHARREAATRPAGKARKQPRAGIELIPRRERPRGASL